MVRRNLILLCAVFCVGLGGTTSVFAQIDATFLRASQSLRAAAESTADSVVQIETLGGLEQVDGTLLGSGPSTGVIVSPDGLVVTSEYIVVSKPTTILVRLPNGERKPAEVIARDFSRNLILLKVFGVENLPVPEIQPLDDVQVGQWVVAVGRTFQSDTINTNIGIVSATDRVWGKALQTDAKVSPNNYGGPIVDLKGRVVGILVPISPQSDKELAGTEWYDSGIGFAIPMSEIMARLERWSSPEDLHPGKLGVNVERPDQFSSPVVVARVGRKSPAGEAGVQVNDVIVEIDGRPIRRYPDVRHALGRRYAGETVAVGVERDGARLDLQVPLAQTIEPFHVPSMGALPANASGEAGVGLRQVIAGGPAATAGLQNGDRILSLNGEAIDDVEQLLIGLAAFEPGESVELSFTRDGQMETATLVLQELSAELLPIEDAVDRSGESLVETMQLEQFANECDVILPPGFQADGSFGLLVWLSPPGKHDAVALEKDWGQIAARERLVVIAPHASEERRWNKSDVEIVNGFIQRAIAEYQLDPRRSGISGQGAGTAMAVVVAADSSRPVQGVAILGTSFPTGVAFQENEPTTRLSLGFWLTESQAKKLTGEMIAQRFASLALATTTVTVKSLTSAEAREQIAHWVSTLDRL